MKKSIIVLLLLFLTAGAAAAYDFEIDGEPFVDLEKLASELDEPFDWFFRSDGVRVRFGAKLFLIQEPTLL